MPESPHSLTPSAGLSEIMQNALTPIEEVIEAVRRGEFVLLVDDVAGGPGVLTVAAEKVTTGQIAFMIRRGGGIISVPLPRSRLQDLEIPLMVNRNSETSRTAFTISVDAKEGVTTGISASDRWRSIQALIGDDTQPDDLVRPGHIYPLQYQDGGVLRRAGYTEAAIDLVKEAGLYPGAVLTDVMNDQGDLLPVENLVEFVIEQDITACGIADVIAYRRRRETLVTRTFETHITRNQTRFRAIGFRSFVDGGEHLALVLGDVDDGQDVLVRVHVECLAGDVFHSDECNCSHNLVQAIQRIEAAAAGVLLYIRPSNVMAESSLERLVKHRSSSSHHDGSPAVRWRTDERDYGVGAQILYDLGVRTMWIITDHPKARSGIGGHGLSVIGFKNLSG